MKSPAGQINSSGVKCPSGSVARDFSWSERMGSENWMFINWTSADFIRQMWRKRKEKKRN